MTHTIELDVVVFKDINELYKLFVDTNIEFKILVEDGPGGGWPSLRLTSDETTLREWLLENYCDEDHIDFYMGLEV